MPSPQQLRNFVTDLIKPLRNKIVGMNTRAVIESIDDSMKMQLAKISLLKGQNRSKVERFQDYGFTSVPHDGAEGIVICPQGNSDHMILIKVDDRRFRLKALAKGEVALYTDEGDKIYLKRGGKIIIDSDNVEIGRGALEKIVNGETFATLYNGHQHLGNLGVPTGTPMVAMGSAHLSNKVKGAK